MKSSTASYSPIYLNAFDQQPILDLTKEALEFRVQNEIDEKKLRSFGVLVPAANQLVPSLGGLILFGRKAQREQYVPDARVSCTRFVGNDRTNVLESYEIEGTILDAIDEVPKFITRNTRFTTKTGEIPRKDVSEYSQVAVQEALINALAHADYSIRGLHIQISIFDDRLEIQNPGMLPPGLALKDLEAGISRM